MPRYTKQRDRFNCGPVAILNALRWAGVDAGYDECIDYLSELCECAPPDGCTHKRFDKALRRAGKGIFRTHLVRHPSLRDIERHLQAGGVLVLNYYWRDERKGTDQRHFHLIAGISPSGRSFYTVNRFRQGKALRKINRGQLKRYDLRFQRTDPYYKAWFLTREG